MKFQNSIAVLLAGLMAVSGGVFTSCEDDDDLSTNQLQGGVSLNAAQLQVTRGGYMQFKGTGLNQIETIIFPENVTVSDIEVVDQYTIRCVVPEEAVVGKVALCYGDKVIETAQIAFTEPIEINEVTPKSVKPGDVITVKGRYFEIFTDVYFATGEPVAVTPTRNEMKIVVPVDASTGEMTLAYTTVVGEEVILNEMPAAEIEVAMPTVESVTSETFKAGSNVTIKGTLLNMVQAVRFTGSVNDTLPVAENPLAEKKELTAKIPATALDGAITLVLYSGLEIQTSAITVAKPEVAIKDAAASYGVGEKVVLAGANIDLVKQVAFTGAEATDAVFNEAGEIEMTVTAPAQSGDITLTLNNGSTMAVKGFVTTKPVVTMPESATQLATVTFESTLASRVVKVLFGDLEVEVTAGETSFPVLVPLQAQTGKFSVVMDNGEIVEVGELTINPTTACVIFKDENGENVEAGSLYVVEVANEDKLTDVKINGESVQYILQGTKLYISTNANTMGGNTTLTLVSGSENADFNIFLIPFGKVEKTIMVGPVELSWEPSGQIYIPAAQFADVPVGAKLKIYLMDIDGAWCQAQINDGSWTQIAIDEVLAANAGTDKDGDPTFIPSNVAAFDWWSGNNNNTEKVFEIKITADLLSTIATKADANGNGMILQGQNMIISKIAIEIDYSAPTPIWSGSFDVSGWKGSQDLAWGGFDWSTVKVGQTLYFTYTKATAGAWGCISLRHGTDWGALAGAAGQYDLAEDSGVLQYVITQETYDDLIANNGLVFTGDNAIVSEVAIK